MVWLTNCPSSGCIQQRGFDMPDADCTKCACNRSTLEAIFLQQEQWLYSAILSRCMYAKHVQKTPNVYGSGSQENKRS